MLKVESFQKEDLPSLLDLYKSVATFPPPDLAESYWRWRYAQNPFQQMDSPSFWVVKDQGKIVGAVGQMNFFVCAEGREIPVRWGGDLMVHPNYRGKGVAIALMSHYRKANSLAICMGWGFKSPSVSIVRRAGFEGFKKPLSYVFKFYSLRPFFTKFTFRAPFQRVFYEKPSIGSKNLHEVNRLDSEFDNLWHKVSAEYPVSVVRDHRSMNWRYCDHPFFRYRIFTAWEKNALIGCLILKVVHLPSLSYGTIPEFVVLKNDVETQEILLDCALDVFEQEKIDVVKVLAHPSFLTALFRKKGFFFFRKFCDFVFSYDSKLPHVLGVKDAWYLTKGDGDLDMIPDFKQVSQNHASS